MTINREYEPYLEIEYNLLSKESKNLYPRYTL